MYGDGKSDRLIVAVKRSNKDDGAPSLAESVEPSSLTKGNSFQLTKYRCSGPATFVANQMTVRSGPDTDAKPKKTP